LRRTTTDLGPAGWDADTGFGLLNLQAALVAPAPARDPEEPNDDVAYVRPNGIFARPTPLLTSPDKRSAALTGRLAATDDPRDVYRLWLPRQSRVRVTAHAVDGRPLMISLWSAKTRSVGETGTHRRADLLGSGSGAATATIGKSGTIGYVTVGVGAGRHTDYALSVTTPAAR
jgi:hypothetical protein